MIEMTVKCKECGYIDKQLSIIRDYESDKLSIIGSDYVHFKCPKCDGEWKGGYILQEVKGFTNCEVCNNSDSTGEFVEGGKDEVFCSHYNKNIETKEKKSCSFYKRDIEKQIFNTTDAKPLDDDYQIICSVCGLYFLFVCLECGMCDDCCVCDEIE